LLVVFVPSLAWVVEVVLDFPLGSEADVVLVFFDGSLAFVVLLFSPVGFSVVVVFEVDCATAAPPSTNDRPSAQVASFDVKRMGLSS
jgi:hypothetical protein